MRHITVVIVALAVSAAGCARRADTGDMKLTPTSSTPSLIDVQTAPASVSRGEQPSAPVDSLVLGQGIRPDSLAARLKAAGFTGGILSSEADLARYATDYGRIASGAPLLVVKPKTTEDVQRVVYQAIAEGLTVRARSGGHALEGQSLAEKGIVIATDDMRLPSGNKIELDEATGRVRMIPGVKIGDLTRFLADKGYRLRCATMDDYPGVGGALSSAGTGRGSHVSGTMVDHVMRLVGVTGTGARIDVKSARSDYSELVGPDAMTANLMLGSFGQAGVITEVEFPVEKVKGHLRKFGEMMPSLAALREGIDKVVAKNEVWGVWGVIAKDPKSGKQIHILRTIRDVEDGSSGEPITSLPDPGEDPKVLPAWLSVIFPSTDGAIAALEKHPELVGDMTNPGLTLLIPQKKMRDDQLTLNSWPKAKTGDVMMGLGVFYYGEKSVAAPQVEKFRAMRDELVHEMGGHQYLTEGLPAKSPKAADEWRRILGADKYNKIVAALDVADPFGVFPRLPGLERQRSAVRRQD